MTLDEAVEAAARAVCRDTKLDADDLMDWGPMVGGSRFRVNKPRETWECIAQELKLRTYFLAMEATGIVEFETRP